jgi:Uma2 family endonuclease
MKKAALDGAAGNPEYWVLDLNGRQLLGHHQPAADGYRDITPYSADESVAPLARPDASARVGEP